MKRRDDLEGVIHCCCRKVAVVVVVAVEKMKDNRANRIAIE
jgi:hypothetical protein